MKKSDKKMNKVIVSFFLIFALNTPVLADLEGDVKLACEAILCFSSGSRPGECAPSLHRYFKIDAKKLSSLIKKRIRFLSLCPIVDEDPEMKSLANIIGHGAGFCDAEVLLPKLNCAGGNTSFNIGQCLTDIPEMCKSYSNHQFTVGLGLPVSKQVCEEIGFWGLPASNIQTSANGFGNTMCTTKWFMPEMLEEQ